MHRYSPLLFAVIVVSFAGCRGGGSTGTPPPPPSITGVAVTPATVNVALGLTNSFPPRRPTRMARPDVTSSASWTSSSAAVTTITSGLAMTKSQGTATITAQAGSASGSASLVVGPPARTSIALTGPATVQLGGMAQFKATANYTDGTQQDVSNTVTWSLATTFRAQISASGLLTPIFTGWENNRRVR